VKKYANIINFLKPLLLNMESDSLAKTRDHNFCEENVTAYRIAKIA